MEPWTEERSCNGEKEVGRDNSLLLVKGVVGCSPLSDDQQSHVWNNVEDQKDDFEQSEERVKHHVEDFSGNGNGFTLYTVH